MINRECQYWGAVISVDDETKSGRLQISVSGVFDEIAPENIPWAEPLYANVRTHDLPYVGQVVRVLFENDSIYEPRWFEPRGQANGQELSDDDYASGSILLHKDLSLYGLDGLLSIRHTNTEGLILSLTRSDTESIVNIRPDNSIALTNGRSGQVLHMSEDNISIGTETKSAEPATLGTTNEEALNKLNDFIDEFLTKLASGLANVASAASASPYTASLAPPLNIIKTQMDAVKSKWYDANSEHFVKTKSEKVTLD